MLIGILIILKTLLSLGGVRPKGCVTTSPKCRLSFRIGDLSLLEKLLRKNIVGQIGGNSKNST